jgi:hypothetical protein
VPELVHKLPPNAAAEEAKGLIDHAKREPPAEPSSPSVRCECDGGPGSKGKRMLAFSEPACKHCGGKMDMVAGQRDYTSSVALVEGVGRRGGRSDIRAIRHLYEFVVRNA